MTLPSLNSIAVVMPGSQIETALVTCEFFKDLMQVGLAESTDIADIHAQGKHGICHNGAIASQFLEPWIEFNICTFSRRGGNFCPHFGDRWHGFELITKSVPFSTGATILSTNPSSPTMALREEREKGLELISSSTFLIYLHE